MQWNFNNQNFRVSCSHWRARELVDEDSLRHQYEEYQRELRFIKRKKLCELVTLFDKEKLSDSLWVKILLALLKRQVKKV